MIELIRLIQSIDPGMVAMGAVIWICWYLVRDTVVRLSGIMDRLARKVERIGDKVDDHEKEMDRRSNFVRNEHQLMIDALGRINGYGRKNEPHS